MIDTHRQPTWMQLPASRLLQLLLALCVPFWAGAACAATARHALIIGNAAYQGEAPLANTLNDARDMAARLRGLGFEIAGGGPVENAGRGRMARAINRFLARVQGSDGIALIYYSGHGMRDRHDASYLIPVDARIEQEPDVRADGIALAGILDQLAARPRDAVSLVIVDACRNNPFATGAKGGMRGLARVEPARGSLVLYSASPGQQASDNPGGRNGLFTEQLLTRLGEPGLDVEDAFDAVSLAVEEASGAAQIPWSGGNLRGKVYLAGAPAAPRPVVSALGPEAIERALELTRDERRQVQQALNGLGHAVGEADGVWGQRTREGIAAWQRGAGREASGYLGADGYKALLAAAAEPGLTPGRTFRDRLHGGGEGPEMVVVPAGSFQMGSSEGEANERPVHRVIISRAFAIGTTEVTFEDYDRFARATGRELPDDGGWGRGQRPVITISWEDASAYAAWLSEQTGAEYRLPSEAEWEYTARAGTTTAYWWGDEEPVCRAGARNGAKFDDNAACRDTGTEPVKTYSANPWGLYDTAGNVWEWVADWYGDYPSGEVRDPLVRQGGSLRVRRGGSWGDTPRDLRGANRSNFSPGHGHYTLGFRLARTL